MWYMSSGTLLRCKDPYNHLESFLFTGTFKIIVCDMESVSVSLSVFAATVLNKK